MISNNNINNMKTEKLSKALHEMQDEVIGLYHNQYTDNLEPVINDDKGYLTIITIGTLLGLHTEHREGDVFYFPENKTLTQMMEKPIEFDEWYKSIKE